MSFVKLFGQYLVENARGFSLDWIPAYARKSRVVDAFIRSRNLSEFQEPKAEKSAHLHRLPRECGGPDKRKLHEVVPFDA
jgi:hypothetical protein